MNGSINLDVDYWSHRMQITQNCIVKRNSNSEAFFALLRAGLWENCGFKVSGFKFQSNVD